MHVHFHRAGVRLLRGIQLSRLTQLVDCLPSLAVLAGLASLTPSIGYAQALKPGFAPNELSAALRKDLIDMELSAARNMCTWCDMYGALWVGTIDPATANIKPNVVKLDDEAITPQAMAYTTNGPEWISTATGDHIVYTKFKDYTQPSYQSAQIAYIEGNTGGTIWSEPKILGPGNAAYTSGDLNDPKPRISYVKGAKGKFNHYWRYLYGDTPGSTVTEMTATPQSVSVRFVKGDNSLVYSQAPDANGLKQVYKLALDTNKLTQITSDAGNKDLRTVPWMWMAPDYNNKPVLMTTVEEKELRFYKKDSSGAWAAFSSVMMPEGSTVASPEPFTYQGKSYVSLAVKSAQYGFPSAIYIAAVSPKAKPQLWKVSDDTDGHERIDPEIFISTDNGPVVFYNKFDPSLAPPDTDPALCLQCSEGLFRATTGL